MLTRLSAVLLVLCFLPWPADADEIPSRVIIQDPTHITMNRPPEPWLIPTRLLAAPYSSWSQDDQNRAAQLQIDNFNAQVEAVRRLGRSGECSPAEALSSQGSGHLGAPADRRLSVVDVAGTRKNILIGEVVASESVWDAITRQISSLVYLKVKQVVRGLEPIAVGDIVTFRRSWGTVTVRGVTLCSYPGVVGSQTPLPLQNLPERQRPTFLILGRLIPGNGLFLNTQAFEEFPVIEGKLHYPQGVSYYLEKKPEDLQSLIGVFQGATQ